MLKFHISDGSWTAVRASRGAAAEGRIEKVKAPRRYFRVLWPRGVVSLSAANEERQKKKKKNRRDQYGSTGYTRNQLRLAANHPSPSSLPPSHPPSRQPLCAPFPGRLRRKAKSTGVAGRRSHGGVRVARQPFALSSTTVMDRARLRPYHHHITTTTISTTTITIAITGTLPPRGAALSCFHTTPHRHRVPRVRPTTTRSIPSAIVLRKNLKNLIKNDFRNNPGGSVSNASKTFSCYMQDVIVLRKEGNYLKSKYEMYLKKDIFHIRHCSFFVDDELGRINYIIDGY